MIQQISILIYEPVEQIKTQWREALIYSAVRLNCEFRIDWIRNKSSAEAVKCAAIGKHLAFVNADDLSRAVEFGEIIYKNNASCELIYYGSPNAESDESLTEYFCKLFPSRPVRFITGYDSVQVIKSVKHFLNQKNEEKLFRWENKAMKYRVPQNNIFYFKSERNYVIIKLLNGDEFSFIAKLTDVEKRLHSNTFVRLHQSYLVNINQIEYIDKGQKSVKLTNGEIIYISKSHYKVALSI